MFSDIKEFVKKILTSRLLLFFIVMCLLFAVLINRIFVLQIVKGQSYADMFKLKIKKERTIPSTRGNIYDRKGELLAYNELAYSVTISDTYENSSGKNQQINTTIYKLIKIIEENGDTINSEFDIVQDESGNYVFTVEGKTLLRFLADVYGKKSTDDLKYSQKNATPTDVINYLCGENKFAIGEYQDKEKKENFVVGQGYTPEELMKMVTIRYAMSLNSFQKYVATTVATDVSEKTVATIMENQDSMEGVDIAEESIRRYVDSEYFSHIMGYTGKISQDEYNNLVTQDSSYELTDMVGKAGIEQKMELDLQGQKGSETVYVDNLGKVIEVADSVDPVSGNDVYLTIDKELQEAVYNILEQKIAGVLVEKIKNIKEYTPGPNDGSTNILIPVDNAYYALFDNNIIDTSHFSKADAMETERAVYTKYTTKLESSIQSLQSQLTDKPAVYNDLTDEQKEYTSFIVSLLSSRNTGILLDSEIDTTDATYTNWKNGTISLKEYLTYAISSNWIDITKFNLQSKYSDSAEIYDQLITYIINALQSNTSFSKLLYKYMIKSNNLSGKEVMLLLYDQNVLTDKNNERASLESGAVSPYNFFLNKIQSLEITPAQLALDPCSGSCVVTDVNTGEVQALVSYPSYDNNRLANNIDSQYYNKLINDKSLPLYDYATQQRTAPGSTFKMVSAIAGLEEGVITGSDIITCTGLYDKVNSNIKCWIYPRSHGSLNVVGGITNSCNYFFNEVGFRLSLDSNLNFNSDLGISKLTKYADMFGLSDLSGVELVENKPEISTQFSIPSAIGQGTHNYTTTQLARYVTTIANKGTCYNLSILDCVKDSDGNVIQDFTPTVRNTVDIKQNTWDLVWQGMRGVVENATSFDSLTMEAAGKTGTAQENKNRGNHALFVGFAPYNAPQIAIATRIAFGYTSANAAEVSRDVFKYYFNLDDKSNIVTGTADATDGTIGD